MLALLASAFVLDLIRSTTSHVLKTPIATALRLQDLFARAQLHASNMMELDGQQAEGLTLVLTSVRTMYLVVIQWHAMPLRAIVLYQLDGYAFRK